MTPTRPAEVSNQSSKYTLADLLVSEGVLTPEQLEQAIQVRSSGKTVMPLGEVCLQLRFMPRAKLVRFLAMHQSCLSLGELLTNLGLISEEQLSHALTVQEREKNKKLGRILVEQRVLTEAALVDALSLQLQVPRITPDAALIDGGLLKGVNPTFLLRHEAIPAFKQGDTLTVIMADPLDHTTICDLERTFHMKVQPAIAPAHEIRHAIITCFPAGSISVLPEEKRGASQPQLVVTDDNTSPAADQDNIVDVLNYILTNAVSEGASDIHIEPLENRLRVRYRIDGLLYHKTDLPLYLAPALCSRIKVFCRLDIAEHRRHQDGRIEAHIRGEEVDLRVSTYASAYGETVVMRILRRHTPLIDLDQLGFSPAYRAAYQTILDYPSGIILITGPTGSGKTTTMYASLHYLNRLDRKIITVEDPIEYQIDGVTQGRLDPKLGLTYSDFIKAMMRQDPDVLMIGEIRDKTSAEAVIQAALTGHKIFSTFHTEDTIGALLRLMDMDIETFLISSTVVCVMSQRLIRLLCTQCREPYHPEPTLIRAFHIDPSSADKYTFYQGRGCTHCQGSGYRGRTGIHELLVVNDAIRDAILARRPSTQIRLIARDNSRLVSLREDGFCKAAQGLTTLEEILRVVFHQESDALPLRSADHILRLCASPSSDAILPGPIPSSVQLQQAA